MTQRTNAEWLEQLNDPKDDQALADLRKILLRGLRASLSNRINTDLDAITEDFVQDALLKILKSLDTFRGESRFTTWAQKIAIHVAYTELRRRRWKDISLQDITETAEGEVFAPAFLTDPSTTPEREASQNDMLQVVYDLIDTELTDRQRTAIVSILQGGMPIDQVARKMNTNRNALYKLIHDARKRLQQALMDSTGFSAQEVLAMFEQ
ncbi:MAG TPA: sigma-70 family RNA polymerase sigma factor [Anaerolineales bacterium]|nr:sigma-70 family RNA polymerase sigma factor [Anaerolineales bacterium]